ncbi:MAG: response regulator containing a CheY-like receiver domain and an DNA-binding domain, partial [Pseudonocardiales bacterium]|nr:response regulator containing a CheY-like receiver domain and an DNA-binding domain [Pseudonocardiales bacterium]
MPVNWPLVGRAREIEEATNLLEEHQGLALAGKPGVGKSRLAREVVEAAAESGWTVRRVSATSQSIPLGAFARWADDVGGAPVALAHRAKAALTADTRPDRLLVFVDDAHLLDELSSLLVHELVLTRAAKVIVTIRAGEPAPVAVTALWKDGLIRRQ